MARLFSNFAAFMLLIFATNIVAFGLGLWIAYTASNEVSYRRGRAEGYLDGHAAGWREGRADLQQ